MIATRRLVYLNASHIVLSIVVTVRDKYSSVPNPCSMRESPVSLDNMHCYKDLQKPAQIAAPVFSILVLFLLFTIFLALWKVLFTWTKARIKFLLVECIPTITHLNFRILSPLWVCLFWCFWCTRSAQKGISKRTCVPDFYYNQALRLDSIFVKLKTP